MSSFFPTSHNANAFLWLINHSRFQLCMFAFTRRRYVLRMSHHVTLRRNFNVCKCNAISRLTPTAL